MKFSLNQNFVVLLATLSMARAGFAGLDPSRVHLVDAYNGNLLFRGNMPTINHTFAYSALVDVFVERTKAAGVEMPKSFALVDNALTLLKEHVSKIEQRSRRLTATADR